MPTKKYTPKFKSSIVALYNEGRSANSLANDYHLAVQTVTGWVKKPQVIDIDDNGQPVNRAQFNTMKKEVACLKEKNEILKLAVVLLGEHRK
ncbi:transposase [Leuconostoc gelidum subsp. gelidum]|uniref:transposase n=1 Tax=Leuconostoc gelidum TaxID=1244 RepID=UPI001CC3C05D|nr:transposase [Leuconostoc gelidum]MBZ6013861.1 transposase [Leuconostoc gelidum subsp. gelidum]